MSNPPFYNEHYLVYQSEWYIYTFSPTLETAFCNLMSTLEADALNYKPVHFVLFYLLLLRLPLPKERAKISIEYNPTAYLLQTIL